MSSRPRLSVHMLVRDGAAVVGRALRSLRGIADEVCVVDTGSTDGTLDEIREICSDIGAAFASVAVSPASRPELYFQDVPETYISHLGSVLECSGSHLLRDWSEVRNQGLWQCRGEYLLKLDADDEVMTPESILSALDHLDRTPHIDLLACPYEVMSGRKTDYVTMYTRLWRNKPEIVFREICHENVDWCRRADGSNWIMTNEGLWVRDWRDAVGSSRVPYRNFKTLLVEYLRNSRAGVAQSPHVLLYLADEAAELRPVLALTVLDELTAKLTPADEAWILCIRARAYEHLGLCRDAGWYYQRAASLGWGRACLRHSLMHARRGEQGWGLLLEMAIAGNEGLCYPRYASRIEIDEAKKFLEEGVGL